MAGAHEILNPKSIPSKIGQCHCMGFRGMLQDIALSCLHAATWLIADLGIKQTTTIYSELQNPRDWWLDSDWLIDWLIDCFFPILIDTLLRISKNVLVNLSKERNGCDHLWTLWPLQGAISRSWGCWEGWVNLTHPSQQSPALVTVENPVVTKHVSQVVAA